MNQLNRFLVFYFYFQLCLFAHSRYNHVNYTWDNRISFSHLFLKGWTEEREVNAYPPNLGPFAIYNKDDFYDTLDYAVVGVSVRFVQAGSLLNLYFLQKY